MSDTWIDLEAEDGHRFRVWRSLPPEEPLGSVVVLSEMFGVNRHIRWVAGQISAHGYAAYAPSLFDRVGGPLELGYDEASIAIARERVAALDPEAALRDIAATAAVAEAHGLVGTVGFGWGGALAWRCAIRHGLPSVCYYGVPEHPFLDETPLAPILVHFGRKDGALPVELEEALQRHQPRVVVHHYEARNGFNCNERPDFHAESSALAWRRTFAFLRTHLAESPRFALHPTLAADCFEITDLPLCRVLLMDDARYPWLILVPRIKGVTEITDLAPDDRHRLIDEIGSVSLALRSIWQPTRINVAALGNRVPQLHWHVIARFEQDAAWPEPVWGRGERQPYNATQRRELIEKLRAAIRV